MGQRLLSFVDEKPTWNPLATFPKLFIALFFTPPSQNDFCLTWNFFFDRASCDFSRHFAAPRLSVLSRDVKYLLSHVSWTLLYEAQTRLYLKIMFFFNILSSPHDFYYLHSFLHAEEHFCLG